MCTNDETFTATDFTPSDVIDDFQPRDDSIDIVGYVTSIQSNAHTSTITKFKKFLCCNAAGRSVQIIAWKKLIPKLDSLQLGSIVHVSGFKYNIPKKELNKGNVVFELLLQNNSEIEQYGQYSERDYGMVAAEVAILDAYDKIDQKIKVDGVIKTEPRVYKNRDFVSIVASLTNGYDQLEMKFNFKLEDLQTHLIKGHSVEVVGTMEKYSAGSAILRVDNPTDITILERERLSFVEILNEFRTKAIE